MAGRYLRVPQKRQRCRRDVTAVLKDDVDVAEGTTVERVMELDVAGQRAREAELARTERRAQVDGRRVGVCLSASALAAQPDRDRQLEVDEARLLDERLASDQPWVLLDSLAQVR